MATSLEILEQLVTIRGASSKYNFCSGVGNSLSDAVTSAALPPEEVASWDISGNNYFYSSYPNPFCLSAPSFVRSQKLSACNGIFLEKNNYLFLNGNGLFRLTSDFSQDYVYDNFSLHYTYPNMLYLEGGVFGYDAMRSLISAVYEKFSEGYYSVYFNDLENVLPWKTDSFPKIKMETGSSFGEKTWVEGEKKDLSFNYCETLSVFLDDLPSGIEFAVEKSSAPYGFGAYVSSADTDYTHFNADFHFEIEMNQFSLENATQLNTVSQLEQIENILPNLFSNLVVDMNCQNLRMDEYGNGVTYDSLSAVFRLSSSAYNSQGQQIVLSAENPYANTGGPIHLYCPLQMDERTVVLESYPHYDGIQMAKPFAHGWINSSGQEMKYSDTPNNFPFITTQNFVLWKGSRSGTIATRFDADKLAENNKINVLSSAIKTTDQMLTTVEVLDNNNSLLRETTNILFR